MRWARYNDRDELHGLITEIFPGVPSRLHPFRVAGFLAHRPQPPAQGWRW